MGFDAFGLSIHMLLKAVSYSRQPDCGQVERAKHTAQQVRTGFTSTFTDTKKGQERFSTVNLLLKRFNIVNSLNDSVCVQNMFTRSIQRAAIQPDVFLTEEAQVTVVDAERKVCVVTVEGNDLALRVSRHPVKEDTFVVFHSFYSILICLTGEIHLMEGNHACLVLA